MATYASLPVSTTHAIVGSLTGVALFNGGLLQVNWVVLTRKIAIPMLLGPILAFGLTVGLLKLWRAFAADMAADCICIEDQDDCGALHSEAAMAQPVAASLRLRICDAANRFSPAS